MGTSRDQPSRITGLLHEVLPYIKRFRGKTFLVKYGGSAMIDEKLRESFARDMVLMKWIGMHPVIVHGGGARINDLMKKLGKDARFVKGVRVTDSETMDVVEMVLGGLVNKEIVMRINSQGGRSVGLTGKDDGMIEADPMRSDDADDVPDGGLGYVGQVRKIKPDIIQNLVSDGFIPVIAPIGIGDDGLSYNINADLVAGHMAKVLGAEKLIILTDQPGLLDGQGHLLPGPSIADVYAMLADGIIVDGMIPKINAVLEALEGGVEAAHIVDGRVPGAVLVELFTDKGVGTRIRTVQP